MPEHTPKAGTYRIRLLWGRWWVESWGECGPWRRIAYGHLTHAEAKMEAERRMAQDRFTAASADYSML